MKRNLLDMIVLRWLRGSVDALSTRSKRVVFDTFRSYRLSQSIQVRSGTDCQQSGAIMELCVEWNKSACRSVTTVTHNGTIKHYVKYLKYKDFAVSEKKNIRPSMTVNEGQNLLPFAPLGAAAIASMISDRCIEVLKVAIDDICKVEDFFCPGPDGEYNELKKMIWKHIYITIRKECSHYNYVLDQMALSVLRIIGDASIKAWEFYCDKANQEYRVQAAVSFPLLGAIAPYDRGSQTIIDKGLPLAAEFGKRFGVKPSVIRKLAYLRPSTVCMLVPQIRTPSLRKFLNSIDNIPLDWLPIKSCEWKALAELLRVEAQYQSLACRDSKPGRLLRFAHGQYRRFIHCIMVAAKSAPDLDKFEACFSNIFHDARDVAKALAVGMLSPYPGSGATTEMLYTACDMLYGNLSPLQIIRVSSACHNVPALFEISGRVGPKTWPSLCDSQTAPNGLIIEPITSVAELRREGNLMHHCVAVYEAACKAGCCHILSIRNAEGRSLSTAQLQSFTTVECAAVTQHRGFHNSIPPQAAQSALKWFMSRLNQGGIPINDDVLKPPTSVNPIEDPVETLMQVCERKTHDPAVVELWRPYLRKWYRNHILPGKVSNCTP
jgi:hypothetical protein